ncbi:MULTISPECIES: 2Fe-2S iron-sulfur cluster-binding protein [Marinimicrobium]|uniref:2Fe-2S iron-sulfur cluster-binding protein n=1 Tax=Marinimicrobium TaxID=359337 RepID=UPI000428DE39|nr:2Fe-2S iron-sulfur cluster-binding protein [Marinimicrobium agarilyticum]
MAKITFITQDNDTITAEATTGTVMELAVDNGVQGIDGDCGGVCSCATCHVHVRPEDFEKTGGPNDIEKDMLELDDEVSEYSRLSCQLDVSEALDGIILKVAH